MEDELNIDPRETDYLDDYDMQKAINFYELKMQLASIGYADPGLLASLRDHITANETGIFTISCRENEQDHELRTWFEYDQLASGDFILRHYECLHSIGHQDINRLFTPDVTKSNALAVMHKDHIKGHDPWQIQRPLTREQTINYLNTNIMNTENLGYLQKQLLNLGFGEQMNEALEKQIKAKTPEFTLAGTNEYNKQSVDYTLHFKKGDQNEMYWIKHTKMTLSGQIKKVPFAS